MEAKVRFPEIEVQLTGEDGNAFTVMGRVGKALKRAGHRAEVQEFYAEAMRGDYDHLLATAMRWVTVN